MLHFVLLLNKCLSSNQTEKKTRCTKYTLCRLSLHFTACPLKENALACNTISDLKTSVTTTAPGYDSEPVTSMNLVFPPPLPPSHEAKTL